MRPPCDTKNEALQEHRLQGVTVARSSAEWLSGSLDVLKNSLSGVLDTIIGASCKSSHGRPHHTPSDPKADLPASGSVKDLPLLREYLTEFYTAHNPSKLTQQEYIKNVMERYRGKTDELLHRLSQKYPMSVRPTSTGPSVADKKVMEKGRCGEDIFKRDTKQDQVDTHVQGTSMKGTKRKQTLSSQPQNEILFPRKKWKPVAFRFSDHERSSARKDGLGTKKGSQDSLRVGTKKGSQDSHTTPVTEEESLKGSYTCRNNDTVAIAASRTGIPAARILELNHTRYKGLTMSAKLKKGTCLQLVHGGTLGEINSPSDSVPTCRGGSRITTKTVSADRLGQAERDDVWRIVMKAKMEGECPVCGHGRIVKAGGGFDCAHIDASRKGEMHEHHKAQIWNLVPSCSMCNSRCGTRCMLDFMADSIDMRANIKGLVLAKVRAHLMWGYASTKSPTREHLLSYMKPSGVLDFASFVRDWYHAKHVDDGSCLNYRELLRLTHEEEADLLSVCR
eukprot:CAMPEP_0114137778 /NCGR_PEP_ID=MMETSP0043_2-20121206/15955_1 /TAXON_ID=464988 /ORGANISM="Hemiselmis andersenii, Strain CCMP644" /LENGTH=505 /DNA_ID=CAMNT_0001231673 /DNA_START=24 /DNA_END=1541 /DNA_ORIENTATION=+